ncbi:HNH endonuclease signature motif containing protein [Microbacterium sp.]|uniref:HNH endonuclease signature motif containing protein n=1 Tax=Microbacterium sp. TaxID=51671 RepID=UPI0039E3A091
MLADAKTVFGARQAGVRVLIAESARAAHAAGAPAVGVTEDEPTALPAWLVEQHACDTGTTELRIDPDGNPLYLGREARLFSPRQRIALATRDGGCRFKGCDRPASYCEAHHIDHHAEGGKPDIDRGILLCRFHHMALHHGGWRITRDGLGDFLLHPPDGSAAIVLKPRLACTYAWAGIDPPPRRFRSVA